MNSHTLAKKLLALPNAPIDVVVATDGPYTHTRVINHAPWVDPLGRIRIQTSEEKLAAERGPRPT